MAEMMARMRTNDAADDNDDEDDGRRRTRATSTAATAGSPQRRGQPRARSEAPTRAAPQSTGADADNAAETGTSRSSRSWGELRELSTSLLLEESAVENDTVAFFGRRDESSFLDMKSTQLEDEAIDAWPLEVPSSPRGPAAVVRLHRSGSFTISSPRSRKSASFAESVESEETKHRDGASALADLGSNWRSARTVTSLHHAYMRVLSEQGSLKAALHASERRCADLLRITQDADAQNAKHERALTEASNERDRSLEAAQKRIAELEQDLAHAHAAKADLVRWKQEHLVVEQESLDALRGALDETTAEKATMAQSIEELRELSHIQQAAVARARDSASTFLQAALRRWCQARMRAAWAAWHAHVVQAQARERAEHTAGLAVRRLRRRTLAKSVTTWRAATREARRRACVRESILFRMRHRALAGSVSAWKDYVGRRHALRSVLRRMATFILHRATARAFWTWQRQTAQLSALEKAAAVEAGHRAHMTRKHETMIALANICVARWQGDLKRLVLANWRENAAAASYRRMRHFFQQWREKVSLQSRDRRIMDRAVSRLRNRRLLGVFSTWRDNVQARLIYKDKVGRFLGRMRNAQVARVFDQWALFTQESKEKKRRARDVMRVLRQDRLAIRFQEWAEEVARRREARIAGQREEDRAAAILAQYGARWRNRAVARVFATWTEFAAKRGFLRRFMRRMIHAACQKDLFAAFSRLKGLLHEAAAERIGRLEAALASSQAELTVFRKEASAELSALASKKAHEREHHVAHVVGLMRNRQLARAFMRFKMNVQELAHQRKVLYNFVERWKNRRAFQVLLTWRAFVSKRKFLRKFIDSMVKGRSYRIVSSAFRTWRFYASTGYLVHELQDQVADLMAQRDALSARYEADVRRFQAQRNDVCRRLASKLVSASDTKLLETCFAALRAHAEKGRQDRLVLHRFSQRWRNQTVSKAFAAWAQHAKEARRNRKIVLRFVAQMQRGNLAAAFRAWSAAAQERKANRAKVLMFFRRQEQQTFWRCFAAWKAFARESLAKKSRARGVLLALTRDDLQFRFDQWALYVEEVKEAREGLYKSEQIVERIVGRMRKGTMSRAFTTWSSFARERRARRERVAFFVQRWRMRVAAQAFDAWLENARDRQRLRALTHKCLVRLDSRALYSAFRKWASFAQRALAQTVDAYASELADLRAQLGQAEWDRQALEASLGDQLRVIVAHRDRIREKHADTVVWSWRNQLLLKVMQQWRLVAAQMRRKRRLLAQFVSRSVNALKARAFLGWTSRVAERKRHRLLVFRSVQKARVRTLARAFASLQAAVAARQERTRAAALLARTMRRLLQAQMAKAWRSWVLHVSGQAEDAVQAAQESFGASVASMRDRYVHATISAWQRVTMTKAFTAWKANARTLRAQRVRVATFLYRWRNMRAAAAWRSWAEFCRQQREKRDRVRSLIVHWRKQKLALGLRTWIHATDMLLVIRLRETAQESLVLACWQKGRVATLSRAFRAWLRLAHVRLAKSRAAKTLLVSVKRLRASALLAAVNKWKQAAFERTAEVHYLQERHGIVGAIQGSLVQIVCNAVLFPSLSALGPVEGNGGDASGAHTTALMRSRISAQGLPRSGEDARGAACALVWGTVMQAMSSATHHLFTSDSLQVFEVSGDLLVKYDSQGTQTGALPAGSSLSAYTIRLGQTVAVPDATADPRFNPDIDTPYLRMRVGLAPVGQSQASPVFGGLGSPGGLGGGGGGAGRSPRRATPASPGGYSVASGLGYGHELPAAAFLCVPIFDQDDQVIGLIQASRTPRSCTGADGQLPDEHYLDACVGVLSVAADSISVLLQWACALGERQEHVGALREEGECLRDDLAALGRAKSKLEAHLDKLASKSSLSTTNLSKQLRAAQRKIHQLQSRSLSASRVESDVKRLLHEYDAVMERSATAPARPSTTTARQPSSHGGLATSSAVSETDAQDLFQLEADQRALLEQFPY